MIFPFRCEVRSTRAVKRISCTLLVGLLALAGLVSAQTSASSRATALNDPAIDKRVDSLLKQMTVEEKVGQLVQYSAGQPTEPEPAAPTMKT